MATQEEGLAIAAAQHRVTQATPRAHSGLGLSVSTAYRDEPEQAGYEPGRCIKAFTHPGTGCRIEERRHAKRLSWQTETFWMAYPPDGHIMGAATGDTWEQAHDNMLTKLAERAAA